MLVVTVVSLVMLVGSSQFGNVVGQCNVCNNDKNIACTSETEYKLCADGKVNPDIIKFKCPLGSVCVADYPERCKEIGAGVVASCGGTCGTCDPDVHVKCINDKTFNMCYKNNPAPEIGTCPTGTVCNSATTKICVPNEMGSTCVLPPPDTETKPPVEPVDPQKFCQGLSSSALLPGRFPLQGYCQRYIYCYKFGSGDIEGIIYSCPANKPTFSCLTLDCIDGPCQTC